MTAEPDPIKRFRARIALCQSVGSALAGSGLELRDRDKHLVISKPHDAPKGRIYIDYDTREVTWKRDVPLGVLDGPPGTGPVVDAATIISTLGGHAGGQP